MSAYTRLPMRPRSPAGYSPGAAAETGRRYPGLPADLPQGDHAGIPGIEYDNRAGVALAKDLCQTVLPPSAVRKTRSNSGRKRQRRRERQGY